jgi:hypothetical protein
MTEDYAALAQRLRRYYVLAFPEATKAHADILAAASACDALTERRCETCVHVVLCRDCNEAEFCDLFPSHRITPHQLGNLCGRWKAKP